MITLEQVHENNVVAKQWLTELTAEIKKIRAAKYARESMPFMHRIVHEMAGADALQAELHILGQLEYCLMFLKLYFKNHYLHAGLTSKLYSPELQFSTTSNYIIMSIKKTYTFGNVPHEVKDI